MKKRTLCKNIIIGGAIIGLGFGAAGCSLNNNHSNPVLMGKQAIEDMDTGNFKAFVNLFPPNYRVQISNPVSGIPLTFEGISAYMAKHGKIVNIKVIKKVINDTNATVNYSVKFSDGRVDTGNMINFSFLNFNFVKTKGKWYIMFP